MRNFRKTKNLILVVCLLSSFTLTGCRQYIEAFFESQLPELTPREEIVLIDDKDSNVIVVEKVEELDAETDAKIAELPQKDLAEARDELISDPIRNYTYDKLTEEEQMVYAEILAIMEAMSSDIKVSTKNPDVIDKAFNCVMLDHPELFYISGYSFTKYTRGKRIEKITVSGSYTMKKDEVKEKQQIVNDFTQKCINGYSGRVDEYEKVKYVYEYLIKNTEYDLSADNNQNILSVICEGRTVCQGYAKTTQYLLNKMGVFCILCEGIVKGTESHVWNIVKIDDKYYHVDTTWGDASYMLEDNKQDFEAPEINYDYLCVTDDEIKKTHIVKETVPLPVCDSIDDNYYVREGLYLETVDTELIADAFTRARENGDDIVTLKCANPNVYAALFSHLIDNHRIFDYLNGDTTVNYVEFKEECRISFYI